MGEKPVRPKERSPKPIPDELARAAIAHEEAVPGPGDRVRLVLRVTLSRRQAEKIAARAIAESRNRDEIVAELLERADLRP